MSSQPSLQRSGKCFRELRGSDGSVCLGRLRYDGASSFPCRGGGSTQVIFLLDSYQNHIKPQEGASALGSAPPPHLNVTSVSLPTFLTRWVHCWPPPAAQAATSSPPTVLRCFLRGPENGKWAFCVGAPQRLRPRVTSGLARPAATIPNLSAVKEF